MELAAPGTALELWLMMGGFKFDGPVPEPIIAVMEPVRWKRTVLPPPAGAWNVYASLAAGAAAAAPSDAITRVFESRSRCRLLYFLSSMRSKLGIVRGPIWWLW